jgi:hypothetical protein
VDDRIDDYAWEDAFYPAHFVALLAASTPVEASGNWLKPQKLCTAAPAGKCMSAVSTTRACAAPSSAPPGYLSCAFP